MARLKIKRNGPDDPTYFQLQEWVQQLPDRMNQVNSELENKVYLETQNNEDPISIEFKNDMMETTDYINIADELFKYGRYEYWVEN